MISIMETSLHYTRRFPPFARTPSFLPQFDDDPAEAKELMDLGEVEFALPGEAGFVADAGEFDRGRRCGNAKCGCTWTR